MLLTAVVRLVYITVDVVDCHGTPGEAGWVLLQFLFVTAFHLLPSPCCDDRKHSYEYSQTCSKFATLHAMCHACMNAHMATVVRIKDYTELIQIVHA